jgi:hypothetical protein
MSRPVPSQRSASFSQLDEFNPVLYTAPDEGIAVVFNTERGSALLISHFGSNITACPLHKSPGVDPEETSRTYLSTHGFVKESLPAQGWTDVLSRVIDLAGFTLRQVEQTLALCAR